MFGIGLPELGVIALVALFFLGPEKLPELAKQAGGLLRQARRFADGARDELREQLGPEYSDLELRDLDPRTLVRRHVLEAMEDAEREAADKADGADKADQADRTAGPDTGAEAADGSEAADDDADLADDGVDPYAVDETDDSDDDSDDDVDEYAHLRNQPRPAA